MTQNDPHPIICNNDVSSVVSKLQDYLEKGRTIKSVRLVDISDHQVVILVDDKSISQDRADGFWAGYRAGLGAELE